MIEPTALADVSRHHGGLTPLENHMISQDMIEMAVAASTGTFVGHIAFEASRRVMHWGRAALVGIARGTLSRLAEDAPADGCEGA